jgi:citrate lyase subunit beta/citryl-CoA lyase
LRSLLFVPADSEKKIPKALSSGADVVILDLEDSVALADKPKARGLAREILKGPRGKAKLFVRVNALTSGLIDEDVAAIAAAKPDGLLLPKSESGTDVKRLIAMAGLPVIAIATETAASMFTLGTYGDSGPELLGLTWGMEDLAAALGAQSNRNAEGRPTAPY